MPPVAKAAEEEVTLAQVMQHMRTGQLISGPVKPYKWLDLTSQPKTQMELNVERVMEGCTFKSAMSCVVGQSQIVICVCVQSFHRKVYALQ